MSWLLSHDVLHVTWESTNCVSFPNRFVDEGRVKLLPWLDITEPASKSGSSRATNRDTDLVNISLGSSPTRVRDKMVFPTSSREFKIPTARCLACKNTSNPYLTHTWLGIFNADCICNTPSFSFYWRPYFWSCDGTTAKKRKLNFLKLFLFLEWRWYELRKHNFF